MKSYTDIEQSKKLTEILPIESADMCYRPYREEGGIPDYQADLCPYRYASWIGIPCWSLAALLNVIKDKCGYFEFVYLKQTSDGRANSLVDVYRLSTDVYDVYNKEAVDACVEMISKLHDLKII